MAWARIVNGVVAEIVADDPAENFHPSLVWVECDASVRQRWAYDADSHAFAAPAVPAPTTQSRLIALAALRYAREIAGVWFQPAGTASAVLVATDRDAQSKLGNAYTMAAAAHWVDGTPWKCADGGFVGLSSAEMQALAVGAATYVARCYAREATLAVQLAADPTADIAGGWPDQHLSS